MEIIIALVDRTLVMMILAQTQGAESSIAMLVLMSVLNKTKLFTKIVIKRLAMPTMGMTTNPKTTSSTTWTRHLIVKPMWMLKTKVIKIHQGVTSGTILAMTKGAEDNHNMIKMRGPTLDNVNNLVKIRNNFINFNMPKFKGEDDAEAYLSWALKVDKIFRIHNYSGAKKVAMASLEFEDYANTWWEQVVTLREEKGDPPIDTWEDMKEEMQARFVPTHYKTDLFNKLQKLKQGTKTVEEFFKEMELTMMRANIQESENQTIARFFNGLNYPIKRIVEFQQYSNMVELVHQASKAERQVNEDIKYSKSKQYFASKLATSTPTTSVKPTASSTPSKQPSIQSRMKQTVSSTASSKASTGPSNVTCFKCGTQGHKSFECKNTKVMITMENGDIETLSDAGWLLDTSASRPTSASPPIVDATPWPRSPPSADVDKDQERRNPHGAWKKEEEEGKKRRRKRKKRREEQAGQPRGRSDRATDRTGRCRGRSDRATDRAHPGIVPEANRTEICEVSGLRPVDRTRDRTIRSTARYMEHQDPGEDETSWSREGEEQQNLEMNMKPKPPSPEDRQGRKGRWPVQDPVGPDPRPDAPATGPVNRAQTGPAPSYRTTTGPKTGFFADSRLATGRPDP
ncbi:hypothetical protein QYE76_042301 [Lolium multiflorum]|uniref:CCHC-type domain-containing protein n=1 Tax=Lolium multiflorum TaxID=4521 RepID=A0AAD8WX63_LOLMU|nr:hypothetical protein QYE76_042301 [Lolium multiflorum]